MQEILPLKAYPIRELVQIMREKGNPITLKKELTINSVYNSGDMSGIVCVIETKDKENIFMCGLTHLMFNVNAPLYKEIIDYQRKRSKRIKQLEKY